MYDALIKLNSIKDLYSFVYILDKCSGTFEMVANGYVVDFREDLLEDDFETLCQITDEYAKPRSFETFRAFV